MVVFCEGDENKNKENAPINKIGEGHCSEQCLICTIN